MCQVCCISILLYLRRRVAPHVPQQLRATAVEARHPLQQHVVAGQRARLVEAAHLHLQIRCVTMRSTPILTAVCVQMTLQHFKHLHMQVCWSVVAMPSSVTLFTDD